MIFDFDDPCIGFPRDCGVSGKPPTGHWNSFAASWSGGSCNALHGGGRTVRFSLPSAPKRAGEEFVHWPCDWREKIWPGEAAEHGPVRVLADREGDGGHPSDLGEAPIRDIDAKGWGTADN